MKQISRRLVTLILFSFTSSMALADVWQATNTWDHSWENKYSTWIKTDFNEDFFLKGPWGGIPTDCADALYGARVIFAYQNQLPVYFSSVGASQETSKFDSIINPDQRVKSFILYLIKNVGTKTLPKDTYPVAINRTMITSGTLWSRVTSTNSNGQTSGHSEVIKEVNPAGVVFLIGSTVPAKVRGLLVGTSLMVPPSLDDETGFRRWVWPQNVGNKSQSEGYSLEQYDLLNQNDHAEMAVDMDMQDLASGALTTTPFDKAVQEKLATRGESNDEFIERATTELCSLLKQREEVIDDALKYQAKIFNACMGPNDYDTYSTPSRDSRVKKVLEETIDSFFSMPSWASEESKKAKLDKHMAFCAPIRLHDLTQVSASQVLMMLYKDKWSSDPNDNEKARWGLDLPQSRCNSY